MAVQITRQLKARLRRPAGRLKLSQFRRQGFPKSLYRAAVFLLTGRRPADVLPVIQRVESARDAIRGRGEEQFRILYSPEPHTVLGIAAGDRTPPGEIKHFTAANLADATSVTRDRGIFLNLCMRDANVRNILELGTCAGLGASYLASVPTCETMLTVEGSSDLAGLARETLRNSGVQTAQVVNALFDDAIDEWEPWLREHGVDAAWIDGQHEQQATIRFTDRILPFAKPGSLMMYDDIYWSQDMNDAWRVISERREFSDAVNFGTCGICIVGQPSAAGPRHWDLTPYIGDGNWQPRVPHGWTAANGS